MRYCTTRQAAELAHCTYRQLDHMCRQGLIWPAVPARGSGSRVRFSGDDVRLLGALILLRRLGAPFYVLLVVAERLRDAGPDVWAGRWAVTDRGHLVPVGGPNVRAGWLVDLSAMPCNGTERAAA